MSGIISVGAALTATAVATSTVAAAGTLTIGGAFAIIGAVGATVGAVGAITKVKELQYAGAALGAVGLVGGLASAAGLFGEASSIFGGAGGLFGSGGSGAQMAGGAGVQAAQAASAAAETGGMWANVAPAVSAAAGPTMGYGDLAAGAFETGGVAGEIGKFDAINMAAGVPQGTPEVATALAPNVTPNVTPEVATNTAMGTFGEGHSGVVDSVPSPEGPTKGFDFTQSQYDAALSAQGGPPPPVDGRVPDPAKGLLELGVSDRPLPQDFGLDNAGNMVRTEIPQGGGDVVGAEIGPGRTNQAAPTSVYNNPIGSAPQAASPTPTPLAAEGTSAAAQSASASAGGPQFAGGVTGQVGKVQPPTSMWSDLLGFVEKNQTLSYGAIQAVGSFVSGAMKPGTDQSVLDELSSRQQQNIAVANLYKQQAAMLQRRMENMTNLPVASRQPRAPNPSYGLAGYGVTGQVG